MSNRIGKILFVATLFSFCLVLAAQAQAATAPKTESFVSGANVTLADIFDGVTHSKNHVLAPAPEVGKPLVLTAHDLGRIARAFDLSWRPEDMSVRTVVHRQATVVETERLEAKILDAFEKEMPGRRLGLEIQNPPRGITVEGKSSVSVAVRSLTTDAARGTFTAVLDLGDKRQEVSGRWHETVSIPVLSRPMRRGDIIRAGDISYLDMRADALASSTLLEESHLLGMTPRRSITAYRPVAESDVRLPQVVARGETVTLLFNNSALSLTARGRALESGAQGETVRILNPSSNRIIEGVITGPQTVAVSAGK